MAQKCNSCRYRAAAIYCFTEKTSFCLSCDYMLHADVGITGHRRRQLCDNCMLNPCSLICSIHRVVLCQSCYSHQYNCATYGHRIQTIIEQDQHHNNNNNNNQRNINQRREGMFEMTCNGNNNCERWMFPMNCEMCLASKAVVYCEVDNMLLCDYCDEMIHLPGAVPPHSRSKLCLSCKRLSRSILIEVYQCDLPTTTPADAEEVSAAPSPTPSQGDSNFS